METDQLRRRLSFIEITIDSFANVCAKFVDRFGFGVDAKAKRGSGITTVDFVFADFKNDLCHPPQVSAECATSTRPRIHRSPYVKKSRVSFQRRGSALKIFRLLLLF